MENRGHSPRQLLRIRSSRADRPLQVPLCYGGAVDENAERFVQRACTPMPMLQLSGTCFKGVHEQLIGTEILSTEGRGA
jgi:hypothetical protein